MLIPVFISLASELAKQNMAGKEESVLTLFNEHLPGRFPRGCQYPYNVEPVFHTVNPYNRVEDTECLFHHAAACMVKK